MHPTTAEWAGLSWAPHGRRIVFSDHANTPTKPRNLDTVRPDGSGFRQVTDFKGVDLRAGCSCSYSPDGDWIVYRRFNERCRSVRGVEDASGRDPPNPRPQDEAPRNG
jgi:Tol biopolymer transport system component